ncbi:MAG: ABC transporter ATP-binding protein [Clostridia bacterium]|nr:ABC transporter ATP-binding protein [Clostridia bacterium]
MKTSVKSGTVRRLLVIVGRHGWLCILTLISAAVYVACALLVPVFVGRAIDVIRDGGEWDEMMRALICAGTFAVTGGAALFVQGIANNLAAWAILRELRSETFEKLQRLPLSYIDSHPHGDVVSRIIADADTVADGVLMGFTQLFSGALTIGATLVIMFLINPLIAGIVVVLTPLSALISGYIARKTYSYFRAQAELKGEETAYINETVTGMRTVRAFGNGGKALERFKEINGRYEVSSRNAVFFSSLVNPTTRFVNAAIYAAVAGIGGISCITGGLTVGSLSVFLNYAGQYTKPFNEISGVMAELQNALACAERIFELNDETEIPPDPPYKPKAFAGDVQIDDMSFSYTKDRKLIEHFSLIVDRGKRVAVVGPTGCGKTTLINLLMKFYTPDSGRITLDGEDINGIPSPVLRSSFGMVLQDTWLSEDSVRENLKMGRPEATDEEMIEAAKKCSCHGFISRLKNGYDTVLREGGGLSDGQKQLLCICRAMLSNPPMLILDEATSSIDTMTERRVQRAMDVLCAGRTCFIVAHRLSTITGCDVIIAMKDGKIVEQGSHAELMARNGFYAELYASQFAEEQ